MSYNSSTSQATGGAQASPPTAGKLYSINVEADGTVGGRDVSKWSSRCGALIRALVPISYKDWRLVDPTYLNDLWKALMKEFEMNLEPHIARPILERKLSQFFRTEKHTLRKKLIYKAVDKRAALAARPDDIDKVWWEKFVENEWDEKKKEQCKKNAENRAQNTIGHTLGRRSYNQVYEAMDKENPGANHKRVDGWKIAHKSKTGEILPSALEKWNEIVAVEEKRKAASMSEHCSATSIDDIEHDELAEVFGPDKKNRCRAVTSSSSVKQVKCGQAAKAIVKQKSGAIHEEFQAKMEATVKATVKACIQESMKEFSTMFFSMQHRTEGASNNDGGTPRTEGASNSVHKPIIGQNLANAFGVSTPMTSPSGRQYVMLLSRDQKEVAKGYIATHTICHGRQVARDERIVWVTEVKDPEAQIYEAPQGGNYKLCEIADGGFLIWLQSRLQYLE